METSTARTPERRCAGHVNVEASPSSSAHNFESTSSAVVCRICQSETGQMVRPCACDGSMGTIHENCLNQWWSASGKDMCEICLTKYARTGRVLKPITQWSRPVFTITIFYEALAFVTLCTSISQMFILIKERQTFERVRDIDGGPRTHDWVRFIVLALIISTLLLLVFRLVRKACRYIRNQYIVRFTEHQIHRQRNKI